MDGDGRGGRVGVRAIDQHVPGGDPGALLDLGGGGIEIVAINHQYIAGDDRYALAGRILNHDGNGPEFALLAFDVTGKDGSTDHHRVVRLQVHGGRSHAQLTGERGAAPAPKKRQPQAHMFNRPETVHASKSGRRDEFLQIPFDAASHERVHLRVDASEKYF